MLLEQFGGANGELAAAMQYSIQGLNKLPPKVGLIAPSAAPSQSNFNDARLVIDVGSLAVAEAARRPTAQVRSGPGRQRSGV